MSRSDYKDRRSKYSEYKKPKPQKLRDMGAFIKECDERLFAKMDAISREICADGEIKLIRLIGPTCAGKTTAAEMLEKSFASMGKKLHTISIDDFYFDKEILHSRTKNGEIDYDSPETIDTAELRRFVNEIFTKDRSHAPIFDFTLGRRNGYREYECGDDDVFLFEGIQALYPEISKIFLDSGHSSVEIYIAPQSSVEIGDKIFQPNEIRLMRRIVRDRNFRGAEAEFTLKLWKSVRDNEEKNIFPYVGKCKYSIDTTMPYEIGVLKPFLVAALSSIPEDSPYRKEVDLMLEKIESAVSISCELIPENSIYREFV